uniref:Transcription intermediary factor 1-alpha n=1 Tax=Globodera rostochiensis TaxID=31243 RepID=A0A914I873_GLORO
MVLICDVCHAEINNSANNSDESPPSINLFPCFHKHCDRCRNATYQQSGRIACKVCGCQCLPRHIYDYTETQLDRIYCMYCNIKNRAQVEWCCETCQRRYLCNACTKPHVLSGHSLTPVKTCVPTQSQCHSHLNLPATYLCSCQTRLCVHCLNIHANGQLIAPHEQRYPFAQLADQAKQRLQIIRTNSQKEVAKTQKILPVLQRNKKFVHEMASKARSAVANEIVELCNALIRRGNDIVTHIDLFEQEKQQKYESMEYELKRVVDHFAKIEEFSENALVTAQNDHPGMCSASEFAQSAVGLMSKKLETLQRDVELTQRLPKISYQSDLGQIIQSIKSLGIVDIDGHKTFPLLTTPQNAQMFTVTNTAMPLQHSGPSVQVTSAIRPTLSSLNPPGGATIRQGPALIRPPSAVANVIISASTHPFNVPLPSNVGVVQPTQQQKQHQLTSGGRTMDAPQVPHAHFLPTSAAGTGILSHLLQQGVVPVPTASTSANNSLPNTPTTPNFPQIRQPHQQNQAVPHQQQVIHQQQQQTTLHQQQMTLHPQQQQQMALHHQQQQMTLQQQHLAQVQQQQAARNQMICQQQQQHLMHQQYAHSQQQQSQTANVQQNQILLKQLQEQQQNLQQHQQRQINEHHQQQQHKDVPSTSQASSQNVSTLAESEKQQLLLRLPNPHRQQAQTAQQQQQQMLNHTPSASSVAMPQIVSPPQVHQVIQQYRDKVQPTATRPVQQQQTAARSQQQNPIVVELIDDDDVEAKGQMTPQPLLNASSSVLLTTQFADEQQQQVHHPQVSRLKAQSAAADSTVNAGNGSSGDDSSVSPSPSTSASKRPSAPPIAVAEPFHKRLALENTNNKIGTNTCAIDTEEVSTRSPSISTTMIECNIKGCGNEGQAKGRGDGTVFGRSVHGSVNDHTGTSGIYEHKLDNKFDRGHEDGTGEVDKEQFVDESTSKMCIAASRPPPECREKKLQGDDMWDDYCYVCSQGCDETTGSLGCCETCPKVFHAKCHVPIIYGVMEDLPDDWQCTLCLLCDPLSQISQLFGKREKLLCSKVYLACFEDFSHVEPFLNAVSRDEADYYAVIKEPIWLCKIAQKISTDEYRLISEFIDDMNLLFRNCSTFNLPTNPLSASGKKVYTLYMKAIREFLPAYEKQIWIYISLYSARLSVANSSDEESSRRRGIRRGTVQKAKSQTPVDLQSK